jgi:Zn-dependent peptidase ImmA (M78 family)
MARFVPYLAEEQIERDAALLLAEFSQGRGVAIQPPIPVEDIVEKYLKLHVEFDDTHRLFDVPRHPEQEPDILGALLFNERRIIIDESLDPDENMFKEGRYRFTLAHEGGGHWRLHRHLYLRQPAQFSLFDEPALSAVVCRTSQARERIELQADYYASCLLMPKPLVIQMWHERFGNTEPCVLRRRNRLVPSCNVDADLAPTLRSIDQQRDDEALNEFARPFANKFQVSMAAMRIRLEGIGLLHREVPRQRSFTSPLTPF